MVILKLRIRTADEWRELAPSDSATDPVFVPTTDELEPQQAVIVEISSQLLPNKGAGARHCAELAPGAAADARARRGDDRAGLPTSRPS
jgi:hypothetical protein